jgi:hypothetical protein
MMIGVIKAYCDLPTDDRTSDLRYTVTVAGNIPPLLRECADDEKQALLIKQR